MKNIERLRLNGLTPIEAKYMADDIDALVVDLEALQGALKMTHRAHRLETAQLLETHAKREKKFAPMRLAYSTLLRRICEWELSMGRDHAKLLEGESE